MLVSVVDGQMIMLAMGPATAQGVSVTKDARVTTARYVGDQEQTVYTSQVNAIFISH